MLINFDDQYRFNQKQQIAANLDVQNRKITTNQYVQNRKIKEKTNKAEQRKNRHG